MCVSSPSPPGLRWLCRPRSQRVHSQHFLPDLELEQENTVPGCPGQAGHQSCSSGGACQQKLLEPQTLELASQTEGKATAQLRMRRLRENPNIQPTTTRASLLHTTLCIWTRDSVNLSQPGGWHRNMRRATGPVPGEGKGSMCCHQYGRMHRLFQEIFRCCYQQSRLSG